ncbi:Glycosyltransferase, GT2 family [Quadrisphaera granulorum]|uniref:GT2 family glycosyltransferase n=1 Tax=Quadrisphaera granulorum TaxID=317664 RepID=A0A316AUP7_9ACTN|nr:glycosyltransferase [Quadrisphaera granulorum]PWJ53827.1 GT2 family glycosyltransferase [Quadrisphaera granulorum]SZE96584.1 Glycosyltransferase, GT2 family [Quadrisphaera granulorum]
MSSTAPSRAETHPSPTDQDDDDARLDPRTGVVVITWQRREEALAAVARLLALPERPRVVVVDNGSTDGTAGALRRAHPAAVTSGRLEVVALAHNAGAVGRNVGVARLAELGLRYAAFCDDDTWWEPGSLARAADVLDAHPDVAVLTARIVVEPRGVEDPIVAELRDSPVVGARLGLPGPALGSFLAGASVVRVSAFQQVGGFSARLWLGGEEELCAADLAAAGWELCYLPDLVVHHHASTLRDSSLRRRHGIRNTVWFTLLRRPWPAALRRLWVLARQVPKDRTTALAVGDALRGLPWVLRERRPLPPHAEARFLALEDAQTRSTARRYVG